jgi:predicted dienelactone hydrolase
MSHAPTPPVISVRPVTLPAPDRGDDLQVRISAPISGRDLPVVVFSHGFGSSMDGYAPLADFWAAHGFVVIQPTHLDSTALGLAPDDPRTPHIWRHRIEDLRRVLDELDRIAAAVPGLAGRVDHDRIAATTTGSRRPGTPGVRPLPAPCSAHASSVRSTAPARTCPTPASPPACCSPSRAPAEPT